PAAPGAGRPTQTAPRSCRTPPSCDDLAPLVDDQARQVSLLVQGLHDALIHRVLGQQVEILDLLGRLPRPLDAGFGLLVVGQAPARAVKHRRVGPMESDAEPAGLDLDDHNPWLGLFLEPPDELAAVLGLAVEPI